MLTQQELLDLQFIRARGQLIDLAAFIDRAERHPGGEDFRLTALKQALPLLLSAEPGRAKAILEALSDTTTEPIAAATIQGAHGAPRPH